MCLSITDLPVVRIALGSNIYGEDIKEGDDLYIECHIRANPNFHRLQWSHNVIISRVFISVFSVVCSVRGLFFSLFTFLLNVSVDGFARCGLLSRC